MSMGASKYWKDGAYGWAYIALSSSMLGSSGWRDGKSDTPYGAMINGKDLGNFKTQDEAKEAVELDAAKQARTILARLEQK